MKFKPLTYRISMRHEGRWQAQTVTGFAVDCGLPVMFCVRQTGCCKWTCDEYTTGCSLWSFGQTKEEAVKDAVRVINKARKAGKWKPALRSAGVIFRMDQP